MAKLTVIMSVYNRELLLRKQLIVSSVKATKILSSLLLMMAVRIRLQTS